jgi:hypothetical protein
MFNLFKKKQKKFSIEEKEIIFLKKIISILPKKYSYLQAQINTDFLLGYEMHSLNHKDNYTIIYNDKLESKFLNKKLPNYFILKNIKIWNTRSNDFYNIELDVLNGIIGGFKIVDFDFTNFDFNKIDVSEIYEKHFENKDLESLTKNFNEEEKSLITENIGSTYKINLKEGEFYFFDDLNDGDVIALDSLWNVYILTHDPYKITKIFSKSDLLEILKNGNLKEEALKFALN